MKNYSTPGIYFSENDNAYIPSGAGVSSGLIIGPTEEGPAFLPVKTTTGTAWNTLFGPSTLNQFTALTAMNYHAYADSLYTIRILGVANPDGSDLYQGAQVFTLRNNVDQRVLLSIGYYSHTNPPSVPANYVTIELGPPTSTIDNITVGGILYNIGEIKDKMTGIPNNQSPFLIYIDEQLSDGKIYNADLDIDDLLGNSIKDYPEKTNFGFDNASSPNYLDQEKRELFKFKTISDGNSSNKKVLITITNVNSDREFDVTIYDYIDNTKVLEIYERVNLNPDSANYVGKVIGDINYNYNALNNKIYEEGNYDNMSSLVYLVIDKYVESGQAYEDLKYPYNQKYYNQQLYKDNSYSNLEHYTSMGVVGINPFYRDYFSDQRWYIESITDAPGYSENITVNTNGIVYLKDESIPHDPTKDLKFGTELDFSNEDELKAFGLGGVLGGGYSALSPYSEMDPISMADVGGLDMTNDSTALAYGYALALVQDRNIYDVNLLTTPGVITTVGVGTSIYGYVMNWINNDQRQDVFYIQDQVAINATAKANAAASTANTSYSATYHSWGKLNDGGKNRWCPPSVDIMSVYAFSDNSAGAQSAPAGLSRGGVKFTKLFDYVNTAEKKLLLDNRVNPIVKLGTEGIFVMGNRTQLKDDTKSLSRINVRRLLISLKKQILQFSKYYMYEQPKISLLNRWENQIKQVLDLAVENGGILGDYKVLISTDEADILRGVMRGQIWVKPIRSIEYVILEFNLEGPNVDFNEA